MATPKLPKDHALRRLLWPHIFNGIGVNRKAAATLSLDGGLFTRGWGMKLEGVHTAYAYVADHWDLFKFQTPIELKEKRNLGKFGDKMPLYEDGIPFYNVPAPPEATHFPCLATLYPPSRPPPPPRTPAPPHPHQVIRDYVGEFVDLHYDDDEAVLADVDLRGFYTDLNDHLVNRNLPFLTSKAALSDVLATYIYYVTGCKLPPLKPVDHPRSSAADFAEFSESCVRPALCQTTRTRARPTLKLPPKVWRLRPSTKTRATISTARLPTRPRGPSSRTSGRLR